MMTRVHQCKMCVFVQIQCMHHDQATLNLANWHKTPNCAEFKRLRHAEFSAYVFHSSESFLCRTLVFSLILVVLVLNGGIFTHSSVFDVGIFTYFSFQL